MAAVRAEALSKRSAGFFAKARKIAVVSAGGIAGLKAAGGVGVALTCCIKMAVILSLRKGQTPVHISYRMTPSE